MGQFDQTTRPIAKLDGAAFLKLALSFIPRAPRLALLAWDDARRLVAPGEPDRVNDAVMEFRDEDAPARQAWLVAEMEDEAEPGICWRMGQYGLVLGKEVNPSCDPDGGAVCTLLVNLSGTQRYRHLAPAFKGGIGTGVHPLVVDVAAQDALKTLKRIERDELGLTLLPFCALMKGAGKPAFIRRWMRAVEREPDEPRRLSYRDWALILADLAGWAVEWNQTMEGWMERKSTIIEGWRKDGREEGALHTKRTDVLKVARRLQDPVPDSIRRAIEGTNDVGVLDRWFDAALDAEDIGALRREMQLGD
ncbi:MAG: hypothetical protein K2W96_04560 [Gemmataceae bacterium]|nr:hypothetical protein [Gemmataceae bacterium]